MNVREKIFNMKTMALIFIFSKNERTVEYHHVPEFGNGFKTHEHASEYIASTRRNNSSVPPLPVGASAVEIYMED